MIRADLKKAGAHLIRIADRLLQLIFIHPDARLKRLILWLVVGIGILYPFLCKMGGLPEVDESSYIYISRSYNNAIHMGAILPSLLGMSIWPLLLSFLPDFPGPLVLWYRGMDLIAALIFGYLFCKVLLHVSENFIIAMLLALATFICMTTPQVMENGFKNSYFPAFACLSGALLLSFKGAGEKGHYSDWFITGSLVSFAILLRETLFPYAFIGFIAVWKGWGFKKAMLFALGGICMAALVLGCVELVHSGNLAAFYKGYADRSGFYKAEAFRIVANIYLYGVGSLKLFMPALLISGACILLSFLCGSRSWRFTRWELLFWICVCLIPLYEPLIKYGFYYHYVIALPGLAGCVALLCRGITPLQLAVAQRHHNMACSVVTGLCFLGLSALACRLPAPAGIGQLAHLVHEGSWHEEWLPHKSTAMEAARKIKAVLPDNGTLSVNGYAFMLYLLTDAQPPLSGNFDPDDDFKLGDLGRFMHNINADPARLEQAIKSNPPDVIVLAVPSGMHEESFTPQIAKVLKESDLYEISSRVEADPPDKVRRHQGWLGYEIYRLKRLAAI